VIRIVLFASGKGSNAQRFFEYFKNHESIKIVLLVSSNPQSGAVKLANDAGVSVYIADKESFYATDALLGELKRKADFIVLAGFVWKLPENIISAFPNQIVNIHPALLPKYGGKGMYGRRIHEAMLKNKERVSGITIHYVNENYDEGKIIFQKECEILPSDTLETLENKIHLLEHKYYPEVVEKLLSPLGGQGVNENMS
jgi:phosphoribosylglycinamide formyltransferase-1